MAGPSVFGASVRQLRNHSVTIESFSPRCDAARHTDRSQRVVGTETPHSREILQPLEVLPCRFCFHVAVRQRTYSALSNRPV